MFRKVLPVFRNFYFIAGVGFLIWILLLDANDLISRWRISKKLHTLEAAKVYYQKKIIEVKKDREELLTSRELLEKFAREKYMMKKDKEDVFILQEKE